MSHQSHAERAAAIPKCEWCSEPLETEPDKRRGYHRLCFVEYTQVHHGREIEQLATVAGKLAAALERISAAVDSVKLGVPKLPKLPRPER
jgi:hypothetical protein